ncbi:unnamed protein product [Linum trigynum]|uniref:Integrase catalytic domain-containing protein n=1 Tax=Linum trigynum TaxID=586398 RepID=A0AAV2D670_9ROSI
MATEGDDSWSSRMRKECAKMAEGELESLIARQQRILEKVGRKLPDGGRKLRVAIEIMGQERQMRKSQRETMSDASTYYGEALRGATGRFAASQEGLESLRNELNIAKPENLELKCKGFGKADAHVKVDEEDVQIARRHREENGVVRVVNPKPWKRLRQDVGEALGYSVRAHSTMDKSIKKTIDAVKMLGHAIQNEPVICLTDNATDYDFLHSYILEMTRLQYNFTEHDFWVYSRAVFANLKQARDFFEKENDQEKKTWLTHFVFKFNFAKKRGTPPAPYDDSVFPDVNRDEFIEMVTKLYPLGKDLRQHFRVFIGDKVKKNFFKLLPTDEIKVAWLNRDVLYFEGDVAEDLDSLLAYEYGDDVSFHGVGDHQSYDDDDGQHIYDVPSEDGPPNVEDVPSDEEVGLDTEFEWTHYRV